MRRAVCSLAGVVVRCSAFLCLRKGKNHGRSEQCAECIHEQVGQAGNREYVNENGEEAADMCKAWDDSRKIAEKQGMKQSVEQGETRLADLMGKLLADSRTEDAKLDANDKAVRKKLYKEYGIA